MQKNEQNHYVASTCFTLDARYQNLKAIGKGSYGVVCRAVDEKTSKNVAIKKITPMSRSVDDSKHVLREIRLMRHLGKHENIVSLVSLILRESSDELYIIMELMDSDLHKVLQSPQELNESHFRYFMYQLLCGIKYMHLNRIIHRDLKPGNLLISSDCRLCITDFGLARERPYGTGSDAEDGISDPMTEHVVTRWYRSPELMLCPDGLYDYSVDLWSAGCILGEMLARKPLFPGKNFVHQLSLIFDVIGAPRSTETAHIRNTQAKKFLSSQKSKPKIGFDQVFPAASAEAQDFLEKVLVFVPMLRLTAEQALHHPFVTSTHYPVPEYPIVSREFEFSFESQELSTSQMKKLILAEVEKVNRETGYDVSVPLTARSAGGESMNSADSSLIGDSLLRPASARSGSSNGNRPLSAARSDGNSVKSNSRSKAVAIQSVEDDVVIQRAADALSPSKKKPVARDSGRKEPEKFPFGSPFGKAKSSSNQSKSTRYATAKPEYIPQEEVPMYGVQGTDAVRVAESSARRDNKDDLMRTKSASSSRPQPVVEHSDPTGYARRNSESKISKRPLTVPKSPKFSQLSSQKRSTIAPPTVPTSLMQMEVPIRGNREPISQKFAQAYQFDASDTLSYDSDDFNAKIDPKQRKFQEMGINKQVGRVSEQMRGLNVSGRLQDRGTNAHAHAKRVGGR